MAWGSSLISVNIADELPDRKEADAKHHQDHADDLLVSLPLPLSKMEVYLCDRLPKRAGHSATVSGLPKRRPYIFILPLHSS